MNGSFVRRAAVAGAVLAAMLVVPPPVGATVTGGCQVQGSATSTGTIDLTGAATWHLLSSDVAGGSGTAPSEQKAASVSAYALGLALPVASGSGEGDTQGSVSGVAVSAYAALGRRFVVAGSSDSCSGQIEIILDDVNPLLTALGGGGIAAAIIGLLLVLAGTRMSGAGGTILGLVAGALGGLGLALALEQFGVTDPRSFVGLGILIVAAVIGLLLGGRLAKSEPVEADPTA
jgi:hypothetical protein